MALILGTIELAVTNDTSETVVFRKSSRHYRNEGVSFRKDQVMDAETVFARRWWTLAVLCFSLLVIGMDNTILNVALPTIQKDLGATASQLQWIVDSYTIVYASILLTTGSLGDRFGRKRLLTLGLIVFGVGSVASAFSADAGQLIAFRAVAGTGRRDDHAGHPVHPHQRLPGSTSGVGPSASGPACRASASWSDPSSAAGCWLATSGVRCSSSTCPW